MQQTTSSPTSLITGRFALIVAAGLCYFMSFTMLIPTLPRWLDAELGASKLEIGLTFGAFGLSAALLRPMVGRIGDRYGRRILMVSGAIITAVTVLSYPLLSSIPALIVLRLIGGVGETGAFVAVATATQDLAPDDRRGEAASYFSVAVYLAIGLGPFLGEVVYRRWDFSAVTQVAAAMAFGSVLLGLGIPGRPPKTDTPPTRSSGFLHPAAVKPGALLALSLIGFTGYQAFLASYLDKLNLADGTDGRAGTVFLVYSAVVLVFRVGLARLPDRLGGRRGSTIAFTFIAVGLAIIALWPSVIGVYVGTIVMAFGIAFNYPALFLFVMAATPESERSHSVASFGFFFDMAAVLGAPLLGGIIDVTGSERAAFAFGALTAIAGLVGVRLFTEPPQQPPISV